MSANGFEPLRLPADSWSREHVRSALRVRDISSLFRLLKKYAGVSQTQIGFAVGLEQGYVSKIMNGHRSVVAIDVLDRIAVGCGMPDACRMLLGLAPRGTAWRTDIAPSDTAWHVAIRSDYAPKNDRLTVNATTKETPDTARNHGAPGHWLFVASNSEFVEASEWPVWFGIRLARLVGIVDDWQGQGAPSDALQTLLHQEILTLDIHGDAIL